MIFLDIIPYIDNLSYCNFTTFLYIPDAEVSTRVKETRHSTGFSELVESVGLIMKDVYPDGNCLFTSVCDQLRVRGDFSYTPRDLRHAAVDFLRENPNQVFHFNVENLRMIFYCSVNLYACPLSNKHQITSMYPSVCVYLEIGILTRT